MGKGKETTFDRFIDWVVAAFPPLVVACWMDKALVIISYINMTDITDLNSLII